MVKKRGFLTFVLSVMVVAGIATLVAAQAQYGTAAEAKGMLEKAVGAIKADKAKALGMFAKGEGGFKDRDLYPFCGGPDGNFTAHPTLTGKSLKELKDKAGKGLGAEKTKGDPGPRGRLSQVPPPRADGGRRRLWGGEIGTLPEQKNPRVG